MEIEQEQTSQPIKHDAATTNGAARTQNKEKISSDAPVSVLPANRIKNIIKTDKDAAKISNPSTFAMQMATEMFIEYLAQQSFRAMRSRGNKSVITYKDVAAAVSRLDNLEFAVDAVRTAENTTTQTAGKDRRKKRQGKGRAQAQEEQDEKEAEGRTGEGEGEHGEDEDMQEDGDGHEQEEEDAGVDEDEDVPMGDADQRPPGQMSIMEAMKRNGKEKQ